jgi:hypothetical protein
MKKLITGMAIACLGVVLTAGTAQADEKEEWFLDGSIWKYSSNINLFNSSSRIVRSSYLHPSRKHKATACNSQQCSSSLWVRGGVWARAEIEGTLGGNKAYYDVE